MADLPAPLDRFERIDRVIRYFARWAVLVGLALVVLSLAVRIAVTGDVPVLATGAVAGAVWKWVLGPMDSPGPEP